MARGQRGVGRGRVLGGHGHGCGPAVQHGRAANNQWVRGTAGFVEQPFHPNEYPGPQNLPPNISVDSPPLDYFYLFWDDPLWQRLVTETNHQAALLKAAKPNNYVAKRLAKCEH